VELAAGLLGALLLVIGGVVGAWVTHKLQESRETEQRLAGERRQIYAGLLKPYIQIFTKDLADVLPQVGNRRGSRSSTPTNTESAIREIATVEYKRTAFDFMLMAPDRAVAAYNELMQFTYGHRGDSEYGQELVFKLARLFLEIRRNLVKDTNLSDIDMLRFLITDIEDIEREFHRRSSNA
jgi:hypothetical protein